MRRKGAPVLLEKMRSLIDHHHRHSLPPLLSSSSSNMSTPSAAPPCPIAQQKNSLRSAIKKQLRAFPPARRTQEDVSIQNVVLDSPWFRSASRLCAYISCESLREVDTSIILSQVLEQHDTDGHKQVKKKLYVPRVEDKSSHMRMFNISSVDDLVTSSMNILEPSPTDANGGQLEDVMLASDPVDIFLLPGVAFDRHGRRLGRGGGYYDVFLKKYQELSIERKWKQPLLTDFSNTFAVLPCLLLYNPTQSYYDVFLKKYQELSIERKWKQPLLIALAYSLQIVDDNVIPVTPTDIPVDAIVSPSGVIRISSSAFERM